MQGCELHTHAQVAVKVLEKQHSALTHTISEGNILQSMEHSSIAQFFSRH